MMVCPATTDTYTTLVPVLHECQHTRVPGCTTAMCANLSNQTQALSVHTCLRTAGHLAIDGGILHHPEQLNAATLLLYQPHVQHACDQTLCGAGSDVGAGVLCASSQHTIVIIINAVSPVVWYLFSYPIPIVLCVQN